MALPLICVLKKLYGEDCRITWPISRKCVQAAPLYIDQPGINSIYVTKEEEFLNQQELNWIKSEFDLFINPSPNHPWESDWYNHRSCVEETMLMAGEQYFETYKNLLPRAIQAPRLYPWWDTKERFERTVAIHTTAGYGKDFNRSPSLKWWRELTSELVRKKYKVFQFGHQNDLTPACVYQRFNELSLFEQIQIAEKCEYYIGTDSGFSWIMGALGKKQVSLITNWLPNHRSNPLALAPTNCKNNATNLFAEGGCDNIDANKVLEMF
jgi:hypothetical protein